MIRLFIITCWFRLLSQALWRFIEYPTLYAIAIPVFEIAALLMVFFPVPKLKKWYRIQLIFFSACGTWDLFKYVFLDPYGLYMWDYWNVFVAFGFSILFDGYIFKRNRN